MGIGSARMSSRGTRVGVAGVAVFAVLAGGVAAEPYLPGATDVSVAGEQTAGSPDGLYGAEDLDGLEFRVTGAAAKDLAISLDGTAMAGEDDAGAVVLRPTDLPEGAHRLTATAPGRLPGRESTSTLAFTVDTTPPAVEMDPAGPQPGSLRAPVTLTGRAPDAVQVRIDGSEVPVADDGRFTLHFDNPPLGAELTATDAAGNTTARDIDVAVGHPDIKAVHMTAAAWASPQLRTAVVDLAEAGKINAIELDIKDESGVVGYESQVPLAQQAGATQDLFDLDEAVAQIHDLGLFIVGRLVAFRDPVLSRYAVDNGFDDWLVQTASGTPFVRGYGGTAFTNFANPQVARYNIDLAVEAAEAGFDSVMYDYIRHAEGAADAVFPGLDGRTPSEAVADFLAEARGPVRAAGAFLGAAVFGISIFSPDDVGQNIPMMAEQLDYLSPMVYPSHWGPGEYGVANPNSQPYDIVDRSMADWLERTEDFDVAILPWLQDFSLGVSYGASEVRAQIEAAEDNDIDGFLLWNAGSRFTASALTDDAEDIVASPTPDELSPPEPDWSRFWSQWPTVPR